MKQVFFMFPLRAEHLNSGDALKSRFAHNSPPVFGFSLVNYGGVFNNFNIPIQAESSGVWPVWAISYYLAPIDIVSQTNILKKYEKNYLYLVKSWNLLFCSY